MLVDQFTRNLHLITCLPCPCDMILYTGRASNLRTREIPGIKQSWTCRTLHDNDLMACFTGNCHPQRYWKSMLIGRWFNKSSFLVWIAKGCKVVKRNILDINFHVLAILLWNSVTWQQDSLKHLLNLRLIRRIIEEARKKCPRAKMLLLKSAIPFIIHFFEIFLIVGSGVCAGEGLVYIFIMQKRSTEQH